MIVMKVTKQTQNSINKGKRRSTNRFLLFSLIFGMMEVYLLMVFQPLFASTVIMNPQHLLAKDDRVNFIGASAAMVYFSGNTNLIRGDAGLTGRLILDRTLFLLVADGSYGKEDGEKYLNTTMEHFRVVQDFNNHFAVEAFGQNQFDEFRRMKMRILGGFGPRFSLFSLKKFEISVGSSFIREMNQLDDAEIVDAGRKFYTNRWSNYIYLHFNLADNLTFYSTLYYQSNFADFQDYRLFSTMSMVVNIKPDFSFFVRNNVLYDSLPPAGVKEQDVVLQTGFIFTFKETKSKQETKN